MLHAAPLPVRERRTDGFCKRVAYYAPRAVLEKEGVGMSTEFRLVHHLERGMDNFSPGASVTNELLHGSEQPFLQSSAIPERIPLAALLILCCFGRAIEPFVSGLAKPHEQVRPSSAIALKAGCTSLLWENKVWVSAFRKGFAKAPPQCGAILMTLSRLGNGHVPSKRLRSHCEQRTSRAGINGGLLRHAGTDNANQTRSVPERNGVEPLSSNWTSHLPLYFINKVCKKVCSR